MSSTNYHTPAIGARVVTLLVFAISLWARDANVLFSLSGADGLNLVLAKALAGGDGFRFVHIPETPTAVGFPPLHPFLVSLVWRAWPTFPENLTLLRLLSAAVLAGAAWLVIAHAIRLAIPTLAVYAGTLVGFSCVPLVSVATGFTARSAINGICSNKPLSDLPMAWANNRSCAYWSRLRPLLTLTRSLMNASKTCAMPRKTKAVCLYTRRWSSRLAITN